VEGRERFYNKVVSDEEIRFGARGDFGGTLSGLKTEGSTRGFSDVCTDEL